MIEIPQNVLNKFIVRGDYIEWIKKEALICVYLDLTNMLHWQDVLGWKFRIEDIISQLLSFHNVKEVKVYYGLNEKESDYRRQRRRLDEWGSLKGNLPYSSLVC